MMWALPNDVAALPQMKEAFCQKAKSIPIEKANSAPTCVIPKLRRATSRRSERISQKFRRIFALDVCTRLSLSDSRRVLWLCRMFAPTICLPPRGRGTTKWWKESACIVERVLAISRRRLLQSRVRSTAPSRREPLGAIASNSA